MGKLIFVYFSLVVLIVCAVISTPRPYAAEGEIVLGVISTFSGFSAEMGDAAKEGISISVEEINQKGGVLGRKLKPILRDDEMNPTKGVSAARELIYSEKVDVLLGPNMSTVTFAVLPEVNKAEILHLTLGTATRIVDPVKNPFTFRYTFYGKMEAEYIVDYAVKDRQYKKIAIFTDSSPYGKGGAEDLMAALKSSGVTPVTVESYNSGDISMAGQLTKIKTTGAEVILGWGLGGDFARVAINMKTLGMTQPVITGSGPASPYFRSLAGEAGKDFMATTPRNFTFTKSSPLSQECQAYVDKVVARFGKNRKSYLPNSACWYDLIHTYVAAVKSANSTESKKVEDALEKISYKGLVTTYTFSPTDHEGFEKKDLAIVYDTSITPEGTYERVSDSHR